MKSFELSEEQEAELRAAHPRLKVLRNVIRLDGVPRYDLAFRPANRGEWKRWRMQQGDASQRHLAVEALFRSTCVFPPAPDLSAMLDEFVALPEECADAMLSLTGLSREGQGKE